MAGGFKDYRHIVIFKLNTKLVSNFDVTAKFLNQIWYRVLSAKPVNHNKSGEFSVLVKICEKTNDILGDTSWKAPGFWRRWGHISLEPHLSTFRIQLLLLHVLYLTLREQQVNWQKKNCHFESRYSQQDFANSHHNLIHRIKYNLPPVSSKSTLSICSRDILKGCGSRLWFQLSSNNFT